MNLYNNILIEEDSLSGFCCQQNFENKNVSMHQIQWEAVSSDASVLNADDTKHHF